MRIVIVGGGFAGINFAKQLAGKQGVEIILIDRNNCRLFLPPLLYQVATSFIEPSNISYPFRKMFQNKGNIYFHYGSLVQINSTAKNIETTSGKFDYDILVLAMGTETNFGMANVEKNALPMKNIDDALHIRNHLLIQLEKATRIHDSSERQKLLTVVIAGGGPTGVEVSGMLRRNE